MQHFHEILAPLLVGFTVTSVEKGEGLEGDPTRIACRRGDLVRALTVWGGIYGPMVSNVQERRVSAPDSLFLWVNPSEMVGDILSHVMEQHGTTISAVEHPIWDRVGFLCESTGKVWWTSRPLVEASILAPRFKTFALQQQLAQCMSEGGSGIFSSK